MQGILRDCNGLTVYGPSNFTQHVVMIRGGRHSGKGQARRVPGMISRNRGHIINVGSVAGDAAYKGGNVYCATKAAVKALSDGLRIDVAETPIRVTNLKPGLVETNFSNIRFRGDTDRAATVYQGIKPLTGDDIADVAVLMKLVISTYSTGYLFRYFWKVELFAILRSWKRFLDLQEWS